MNENLLTILININRLVMNSEKNVSLEVSKEIIKLIDNNNGKTIEYSFKNKNIKKLTEIISYLNKEI